MLLLVCPALHHVAKVCDALGMSSPKIPVYNPFVKAIGEVVDTITVGDVGDCGSCLEEALGLGPKPFIPGLLTFSQVVAVARMLNGALEVVNKHLTQVVPRFDGIGCEPFEPGE